MTTGLREAKARLRTTVLARRDAIDPGVRAALSRALVEEVVGLPAYRSSTTVLAYAAFGSEPQTDAFLRRVLDEGKTLLLPRVNSRERTLDVYEMVDLARDLKAGTWRIREPRQDRCDLADSRAAEFVLVPGVAFDRRGGRLGYGGGYYDRLLSGGVSPNAWLVAVAFGAQIVEKVPRDDHDVPVDVVVTEEGRYPPEPPRRRRR